MKDGSIMVIGIAGGTGSGKTTITRKIMQHFGGNVSVIYHDNYYKAHHGMSYEERAKLNYDHPDAFDTDLLIEDIKRLRRGETVHCPTYDYTIHDRAEKTVTVRPARVIIVRRDSDIPEPGTVRPYGYQDLRRHRRGRSYSAPHRARRA